MHNFVRIAAGIVGAVFLFVLPIPHTTTIRLTALFTLAVLCIVLVRREARPPLPLKIPFAAWAMVALISLLYAIDRDYSLGEIKSEIIYSFGAYAVFYYLAWHLHRWTPWLWAVFASLLVLSITNLALWSTMGNVVTARYFYNGVGAYTTFLVTVFPFVILLLFGVRARGFKRVAIRVAPFLFLVPAYFTGNRWVWMSLAVTGVVLFPLLGFMARNRVQRTGLVVGLSLLIGVSTVLLYVSSERRLAVQANAGPVIDETIAIDPRPKLWHFVVKQIDEHPWSGVGFGIGSFNHAYPQWKKLSPVLFHAHNVFLDAGAQMGLPGIVVMLFLFAAVMREYWRLYQSDQRLIQWIGACGIAMVVGVVTKNMTDEFFRRDLALLFWALVGTSFGYAQYKRQEAAAKTADLRSRADGGAPLKFLVIRRDNIGDLVCTTPLFSALRRHFPLAKIYALVNTYNEAILERHPDIDAVYSYVKTKHHGKHLHALWRRLRLLVRLRRADIDYVILAGSGSRHSLNLARALRPKHIIGYRDDTPGAKRNIDIVVRRPDGESRLHEVECTFRLLEPLGITGRAPATRIFPDPNEVALAAQKLRAAGLPAHDIDGNLIGVQISSRKPVNRWPREKYIQLMRKLHRTRGAGFLLLWAPGSETNPQHPGDDETAAAILNALTDIPVIAYPQGSLRQLVADLSLCDFVITSDGGAMHIAAALGKPILCFFGDAASARWRPWGSVHVLLQPPSGRVMDIEMEEAYAAFERLVALRDRPAASSGSAWRAQSEPGTF